MWAWHLVGLAYYAACFYTMYRVLEKESSVVQLACLGLLITVMSANAGWNFIFFRSKDLNRGFWFFVPYSMLVAMLVWCLAGLDGKAALVFGLYAIYLPFALAWMYRVRELNRSS